MYPSWIPYFNARNPSVFTKRIGFTTWRFGEALDTIGINRNRWNILRIMIDGDTMIADETKFGFTVKGSSIEFDNLKVLRPRLPNSPRD